MLLLRWCDPGWLLDPKPFWGQLHGNSVTTLLPGPDRPLLAGPQSAGHTASADSSCISTWVGVSAGSAKHWLSLGVPGCVWGDRASAYSQPEQMGGLEQKPHAMKCGGISGEMTSYTQLSLPCSLQSRGFNVTMQGRAGMRRRRCGCPPGPDQVRCQQSALNCCCC